MSAIKELIDLMSTYDPSPTGLAQRAKEEFAVLNNPGAAFVGSIARAILESSVEGWTYKVSTYGLHIKVDHLGNDWLELTIINDGSSTYIANESLFIGFEKDSSIQNLKVMNYMASEDELEKIYKEDANE